MKLVTLLLCASLLLAASLSGDCRSLASDISKWTPVTAGTDLPPMDQFYSKFSAKLKTLDDRLTAAKVDHQQLGLIAKSSPLIMYEWRDRLPLLLRSVASSAP